MTDFLFAVGGMVIFILVVRKCLHHQIVFEFERGLLFRNGVLKQTLSPGGYWYWPFRSTIQKVDMRLKTISIPSQEILSLENVALKVTLCAQYAVTDPVVAITKVENYQEALYMTLQLALRERISSVKVDEVVAERNTIGASVLERTAEKMTEYGLTLSRVDVKDITFPGELKKMFAQVVNAQKEGLASLERARGETAALRSLANAAKMLENNPALLQLRTLQAIEHGRGNMIVLGGSAQMDSLPINRQEPSPLGGESA